MAVVAQHTLCARGWRLRERRRIDRFGYLECNSGHEWGRIVSRGHFASWRGRRGTVYVAVTAHQHIAGDAIAPYVRHASTSRQRGRAPCASAVSYTHLRAHE